MRKYIFIIMLSFLIPSINPSDGSELNYTHVLFEWGQIENADSYQIQISDNIDFSNILINETSQSLIYIEKNSLDWNNQYYWKIKGFEAQGNFESDWSETFSFTTTNKRSEATATLYMDDDYNVYVSEIAITYSNTEDLTDEGGLYK